MSSPTPQVEGAERVHRAEDILSGATTAKIVLGNQTYTLRLTRAGKLILTK
ncbi:hemin uptake protein HemP [Jannaschia sp. 2305UL9-9]|uniref:hemin uptake protein HemP n=1 Tax=Jannaschia sp. 2305UL9-9 TaxID=3121638 RepID=UPI0035274E66